MALTAIIPTALQGFVPESESTPKAFAEAWRYTPVAGLTLGAETPRHEQHVITSDAVLTIETSGSMTREYAVQAGVTLTLIETVKPGQTVAQTSIVAVANAVVNHVRITECAADDFALLQTHVQLTSNAQYHFYTLTAGAKRLRQRVQVDMSNPGGHTTLAGAYILGGNLHHDLSVVVNHLAPNCTSRQHVKGAVRDSARGAFQGKIHVDQSAQETEAYQLHKAMLLGERAEVDAKPELEIYADRVKCSHGNAIGALDDKALFYLQARGIDMATARQMLTQAFLADTLEYAPAAREMLEERLMKMLGGHDA